MDTRVVILVLAYVAALLLLSVRRRGGGSVDYLLAGRRLTLPVFVATL